MSALAGTGLMLARSAREGARDPAPAFVMPFLPTILTTVVFAALFERLVELSAFTVDEYVDYLAPGAVMLSALLAGGFTATSLANDLRNGYADRLRLLPARQDALLAGRVAFEALRVLPAAAAVLAVAVAMGAPLDNGAAGVAVVLALAGLLSAAFCGVFHVVAILTADPQTPVALQPLGVLAAFLSTALVPAAVMPAAASSLAEANPVSAVVDAARAAMTGDVWSGDVALGLGVCLAGIAITQAAALGALAMRARRS